MKVKKIFIIFLLFNLIFTSLVFGTDIKQENNNAKSTLDTFAPCALLIEKETGDVLFEKDAHSQKFPASTVKIMTAIVALENANLTDIVTVSPTAISTVPSGYTLSNIKENENLTMEALLYAMLIPSGNDAANAIAEYVGGNVLTFANMMTQKSKELRLYKYKLYKS